MRTYVAAVIMAASFPVSAPAQTPQVASTRIEFTRPGGTPGAVRATIRPSETYMIAPAQPEAVAPRRKRKVR